MSTIKVSDYIIDFFKKNGVKDIFMISGGGAIHLNDSLGKANINYICPHHEQAAAMAADAYARIRGLGVCVVTTGPGGTNTLTGLMGAWTDSVPIFIVSGQIRRETIGAGKDGLRQLGDQEINIVDIVKPMTKYAVQIKNPLSIKYHLEKAMYLVKSGRPGPVWIDVPLDVQGAYINAERLKGFDRKELKESYDTNREKLQSLIFRVLKKIIVSERPVLFVGNGVRFSGASKELMELITFLKIPVLTGFAGFDLVSTENKYFAGRPGTIGQRGANFTLQNSDLLLVIGSRLNIRMIGYNFETFARAAYKIVVDIDKAEISKRTIKADLKINYDAKEFIVELTKQLKVKKIILEKNKWLNQVKKWKNQYPVVLESYWKEKKFVNPYCFIEELSKHIKKGDVIALSDATASICTYQTISFPQGTRIITNSGCAPMGYGLPAAIGACFANITKVGI